MSGAGGITTLVARDGGVHSVGVFGELDPFTGDELVTVVRQCLEQQPVRLAVDLSAVSFCDGAGVRALVTMRELAARAGTQLVLVACERPPSSGRWRSRDATYCSGCANTRRHTPMRRPADRDSRPVPVRHRGRKRLAAPAGCRRRPQHWVSIPEGSSLGDASGFKNEQ